jgi:hypothetical protein
MSSVSRRLMQYTIAPWPACRRNLIDARDHAIGQVWTVEIADEKVVLAEAELVGDVLAHARRGGRGTCDRAHSREGLAELRETAIFWPKVVTPLADAVGLIDGDLPDAAAIVEAGEAAEQAGAHALPGVVGGAQQSLGRDQQQSQFARVDLTPDLGCFLSTDARVQRASGDPANAHAVDLILHQRDQRRDDDREFARHQRGNLIAQ